MNPTTCPCGQPSGDGSFLCGSCVTGAWNTLATVPGLVAELETTITRQARMAAHATGGTTDAALPWNEAASRAHHRLRVALGSLVEACTRDGIGSTEPTHREPVPARVDLGYLASWLMVRVDPLAASPNARALWDVSGVVRSCLRVIDRPPELIYAGPCRVCGSDLYAAPGAALVTCRDCGTPEDVEERRGFLLGRVHDQLATATEAARALTSLDMPITSDRIRQWRHRDRLVARGHNRAGHPLYRVGDVVDLLLADTTRTPDRGKRDLSA
jgi:hypothetical protein